MKLDIEFRYFNKSECSRCRATDAAVRKSLNSLKSAAKKFKLAFREVVLPESELHLSPSVTINGVDVEKILSSGAERKCNSCESCCMLVGRKVDCRTYTYKGKDYDYIPKEMIIEAIQTVVMNA